MVAPLRSSLNFSEMAPIYNIHGSLMSFRGRNTGKTLLPFGLDYSDVLNNGNSAERPQLVLPVHGPLTESEIDASTQSIAFCQLMADGGFYTGSINDVTSEKRAHTTTNDDGIERYSDRYKKVKKIGRTIDQHPYQLELFPEELYSVMGVTGKQKKKLLALSTYKLNGGLKQYGTSLNDNEDPDSITEKLKSMADDLADNADDGEDEQDDEDDFDDEFEEDDEDDYNAEKYFDDGDDDGGDDGGDEAAF